MYTSGNKRTSLFVKTKYKRNVENQKMEFWNLESSHFWNPESKDVESVIHSVESGIQDSLGLPYMGRLYCTRVTLISMEEGTLPRQFE